MGNFNSESCTLQDNNKTPISRYQCTGLDSNFFPQSCTYYDKNQTTQYASSTCYTTAPLSSSSAPSSSSASSSMNYCWITTCMHAKVDINNQPIFTPPSSNTSSSSSTGSSSSTTGASLLCPESQPGSPLSDPTIQVQMLQACTSVVSSILFNTPYSCTYRNATKVETLVTTCQSGGAGAMCTITDLNVTYTLRCDPDDPRILVIRYVE